MSSSALRLSPRDGVHSVSGNANAHRDARPTRRSSGPRQWRTPLQHRSRGGRRWHRVACGKRDGGRVFPARPETNRTLLVQSYSPQTQQHLWRQPWRYRLRSWRTIRDPDTHIRCRQTSRHERCCIRSCRLRRLRVRRLGTRPNLSHRIRTKRNRSTGPNTFETQHCRRYPDAARQESDWRRVQEKRGLPTL